MFRKLVGFVDCVLTMLPVMDSRAFFGQLFVATLTTFLFCVSSPCSVSYSSQCRCSDVSLTKRERCDSLLNGNSTYMECLNTCVIPNRAFRYFPCKKCLETLYLRHKNISDIQPDAFTDLKQLSFLYVDNNDIQELRQNTFEHISKLMKLDISFNRVTFLHPDAFVHMKSLFSLNVSHNMLVLNGAILNSNYLNVLDAAYCNPAKDTSWYVLQYPAFGGLPNLTKLVLEGNAIQCIMSNTFTQNGRLTELYLRNNELQVIHQTVFSSKIRILHFSNNPLKCDCDMKKFSEWCSENNLKLDDISCGTPPGAWSLLEHMYCDTVIVTDSPDVYCGFDMKSTNTVTYALPASAGTSADDTTSSVLSTTSEVAISSLYTEQETVILAVSSSKKSERLVELSVKPTTETLDTTNLTLAVTSKKALPIKSSTWYTLGMMCFLGVVLTVVVVMSLVSTIRRRRQNDLGSSQPATHYFSFEPCNSDLNDFHTADENCQHSKYIRVDSLHKVTGQKPDLHYLYRDVTDLTYMAYEVPDQGEPETDSNLSSSFPDTDVTHLKGHIYEKVK